jgi:hypothetical protein
MAVQLAARNPRHLPMAGAAAPTMRRQQRQTQNKHPMPIEWSFIGRLLDGFSRQPDYPAMSVRSHRFGLLLSVTLAGMAVLVIEISATRMLAPFFGNSIFTISSVIGIVLAALGLGYYCGGSLADRKPSSVWFFLIVTMASLSCSQLLNAILCRASPTSFPDQWSADVSLMFFLPLFWNAVAVRDHAAAREPAGRRSLRAGVLLVDAGRRAGSARGFPLIRIEISGIIIGVVRAWCCLAAPACL